MTRREESARSLRCILKALYDAVAAEPVPQAIHDKLKGLK